MTTAVEQHDPQPAAPAHTVTVGGVPQRPGRPPQAPTRPPRVRRVRLGRDRVVITTTVAGEVAAARPVADSPTPALPDPTAMCCSVVRAAVEVLRGDRAAHQLARWVTPVVLDQLAARARVLRAVDGHTAGGRPAQVRRVRLERRGAAAEATVVIEDQDRIRAAAVRLEAHRGQWRIVILELG